MARMNEAKLPYITGYNIWLGRAMLVVWALLVVHYLLALGLGISFYGLANYFSPFLSDLPIFDRLEAYYAGYPTKLAQAREFYLVNNGVLFPAVAICLVSALVGFPPLYRKLEKRVVEDKDGIDARDMQKNVKTDFFGVLFFSLTWGAGVIKLFGYTELPEQGIGRGFLVIVGQFFILVFLFVMPEILASSLHIVFHRNNRMRDL